VEKRERNRWTGWAKNKCMGEKGKLSAQAGRKKLEVNRISYTASKKKSSRDRLLQMEGDGKPSVATGQLRKKEVF